MDSWEILYRQVTSVVRTTLGEHNDNSKDIYSLIRELRAELAEARREAERYLSLLKRLRDLAEFWILRTDRRDMSENEFTTWLALGYGSSAYQDALVAINAAGFSGERTAPGIYRKAFGVTNQGNEVATNAIRR